MKADNHEYYEIINGKMVQVTFVVKKEHLVIYAVRYFHSQGWEIPKSLEDRANLAINRLLQHEARHAISNRR